MRPAHFSEHQQPVIRVPQAALAETTRWLIRPADWEHNGGDGPFNDKRLARVVFTATLDTAVATRWVQDRSVFLRAAQRLVLDQAADGSWPLEGDDATGSPATYGRPLATFLARQALFSADSGRFRTAIDRADGWLSSREILTITDASVCLLARRDAPTGGQRPFGTSGASNSCARAKAPTAAGGLAPARPPSRSIRRSPFWPLRNATTRPTFAA